MADNIEKQSENNEQEYKSLAMELLEELKRQNKRLVAALFTVLVMWLLTIGGFVWYLNQYDFVSYQYDINSSDGGNANYIGNDGDINNYGASESEQTEKKEEIND